jgi:beta-glucanase (GH16 family)
MKKIITFLAILLAIGNLRAQPTGYSLVWADEFDVAGLPNAAKWGYDVGGTGWGNNELQYYTSARTQNALVEGGNLVISLLKEAYQGKSYTSARLVSKNKGDWMYGRIEVKAKLPKGKGTWPAIWMLPTTWDLGNGGWPDNGEIDIMEHVGYDQGRVYGTIHTSLYNGAAGTQKGGNTFLSDCSTAFHVYAIEWDETKILFYIDQTKIFTYYNNNSGWQSWPYYRKFHLILNIAFGGNWGGAKGIDESVLPQKMYIDYVRVYQKTATAISTQDEALQSAINVYPNPARDSFSVNLNTQMIKGKNIEMMVSDLQGKVIFKQKVDLLSPLMNFNLAKYGLKAGVYLITVTSSDDKLTKKLIVE